MHTQDHPSFAVVTPRFSIVLLLLATTALYAHALDFGFMWDDPLWYGRVVGKSIGELVSPMPDYHFYRPTLMLYNRLFVPPQGTPTAPLLHAAQLGWHLLNVALVYALGQRLGLGRWTAVAVGALLAWYPFSYQAVAWSAPSQPMAAALVNGALLTYAVSRRWQVRRRSLAIALSMLLFVAALTVQEGVAALAPLPLLMEWVWYQPGISPPSRNESRSSWRAFLGPRLLPALLFPLAGAGFGLLWLQIPRQAGYTALILKQSTLLYFLQGLVFPLLGRPWGYRPGQSMPPGILLALSGLTLGLLLLAARRAGRGKQALLGLSWALLGIAPAAVGLGYSYVKLGSRLFYHAAPGVALLWAIPLLSGLGARPSRRSIVAGVASSTAVNRRRPRIRELTVRPDVLTLQTREVEDPPLLGRGKRGWLSLGRLWSIGRAALLLLILLQSGLLLGNFRRAYTAGVTHLDEMIHVQTEEDRSTQRNIYINFPDRYAPKRPPYPLGYWGVTLAPVSVELRDFAAITVGTSPQTLSRSVPWIDAQAREAGPYRVDMRGVIAQPDELYRLARDAGAVYLSRYAVDGSFLLQRAGTVHSAPLVTATDISRACRLAAFSRTACLQQAQIERRADELVLTLTWLSLSKAQTDDTIFAHLGAPDQPPVAQADGDAWRGLLPLSVWQPGDVIREQRTIPLPGHAGSLEYEIRAGIYNRMSGERLAAQTHTGERLPDDAAIIGHLP